VSEMTSRKWARRGGGGYYFI